MESALKSMAQIIKAHTEAQYLGQSPSLGYSQGAMTQEGDTDTDSLCYHPVPSCHSGLGCPQRPCLGFWPCSRQRQIVIYGSGCQQVPWRSPGSNQQSESVLVTKDQDASIFEWSVLQLNDMVTSKLELQQSAMSECVAQLQPESVLMSDASVTIEGHGDTQDLGPS